MLFASTVVVVVAASVADESAEAIERAMRSVLGTETTVTVRRALPNEDDRSLGAVLDSSDATLVGLVSVDSDSRARLHFRRRREPRWVDRELRFEAGDTAPERSRTIGYALASSVPAGAPAPRPEAPPPAPVTPPKPVAPPAEVDHRASAAEGVRKIALDLVCVVTTGVG